MKLVTQGLQYDPVPLRRAFLTWGQGYQKLGELTGCTSRTAYSVVAGLTPTSRFFHKIAIALGVDPEVCWIPDVDGGNGGGR